MAEKSVLIKLKLRLKQKQEEKRTENLNQKADYKQCFMNNSWTKK